MKTIWKFNFALTGGYQTVQMPLGAIPLRFAMQGDIPCLWALVDPENARAPRSFVVHGTGHAVDDDTRYVGTCDHGPLVWHLFEHL